MLLTRMIWSLFHAMQVIVAVMKRNCKYTEKIMKTGSPLLTRICYSTEFYLKCFFTAQNQDLKSIRSVLMQISYIGWPLLGS